MLPQSGECVNFGNVCAEEDPNAAPWMDDCFDDGSEEASDTEIVDWLEKHATFCTRSKTRHYYSPDGGAPLYSASTLRELYRKVRNG